MSKYPISIKKLILVMIGISITYSLFILFSDTEKFSAQWHNLDWKYFLLLLLFNVVALSIRAVRQKILLDSLGFPLSYRKNFVLYFSGLSMIMTPAGTGELIKSFFLKQTHGFELSKTIPLVFAEKYHNLLVGVSILSIFLFFQQLFEAQILVLILGTLLIISFFSIKTGKLNSLLKITPKISFFKNLEKETEKFEKQLKSLTKTKVFFSSWIIGLCAGLFDIIGFYFGFLAFNLDVNFIFSTLTMLTSIIFGSLTLIPIGAGITDLSLVGLLTSSGILFASASAFTIFIRITLVGSNVLLGIFFIKFYIKK